MFEKFDDSKIGHVFKRIKEYEELIIGIWVSINEDSTLTDSKQWLKFEEEKVTIKMNNMPTGNVKYEIGFDGDFYIKLLSYPSLAYNILHLDNNLFVIKLRNNNIGQYFKRSSIKNMAINHN